VSPSDHESRQDEKGKPAREAEPPVALHDAPRVRSTRNRSQADEAMADLTLMRTTVNLPEDLWAEFAERAKRRGISKTEAMRRALWLYNLLDSRLAARCDFVVVWPDGEEETIKLSPY
jgi:hypothetical protein